MSEHENIWLITVYFSCSQLKTEVNWKQLWIFESIVDTSISASYS